MSGPNIATDPGMGGTPGQFDLWPWHRRAQEMAAYVSARRSFAGHVLFGRELNGFALEAIYGYEQQLKARAHAEFLWDRAERDRLEASAIRRPTVRMCRLCGMHWPWGGKAWTEDHHSGCPLGMDPVTPPAVETVVCDWCGGSGGDCDDSSKDCDECDGRGRKTRLVQKRPPEQTAPGFEQRFDDGGPV